MFVTLSSSIYVSVMYLGLKVSTSLDKPLSMDYWKTGPGNDKQLFQVCYFTFMVGLASRLYIRIVLDFNERSRNKAIIRCVKVLKKPIFIQVVMTEN